MPDDIPSELTDDGLVPVTKEGDEEALAEANDIFLRHGKRLVLYSSSSRGPISPERWQRLLESRRQEVYVRKETVGDSLRRLSDEVAEMLADNVLSVDEKIVSLYSTTSVAMSAVLRTRLTSEGLTALTDFVESTVSFIANNPSAVRGLQSLMAHDYTTYAHSASVYIHTVALASWLRAANRETLRHLGLGAILHDIGKTQISSQILQKPASLTEDEWVQMKRHPELGVKMLRELGNVPVLAQTVTIQHHERCDGSGYPLGLTRSMMNPLTHIVIVADMYDALTKTRTYRPPHSAFEALKVLKEDAGTRISANAFRGLVLMLASQ